MSGSQCIIKHSKWIPAMFRWADLHQKAAARLEKEKSCACIQIERYTNAFTRTHMYTHVYREFVRTQQFLFSQNIAGQKSIIRR